MLYRIDHEDGRTQSFAAMHIRTKGGQPAPCQAPRLPTDNPEHEKCLRISTVLCDAIVGKDEGHPSVTCDMPICQRHATHVKGADLDYCPRHTALAVR